MLTGGPVARDDDGHVGRGRELASAARIDAVDAAAGRIVDERIDAVPVGVAGVQDVGFGELHGDVAVGVGGAIVLQRQRGAVQLRSVRSAREDLARAGHRPDRGGKSKSQSSTRCIVARCLRVFSWARIAAPSPCSHSLPSAWSKCQWVLIRCRIGSGPRLASASAICGREAVMPASTRSLPSLPGQDRDVAAGAFEHADIAAQPVHGDRRLGRLRCASGRRCFAPGRRPRAASASRRWRRRWPTPGNTGRSRVGCVHVRVA